MMTGAVVVGLVLGLAGIANAEDGHAAPGHARRSLTVYLASAWSPGPTVPIRIGAEGVLRAHHRGLALEARLGFGGAGSVIGLAGNFAARAGLGVGGAFAVHRRIVLAPMIAYDVFTEWQWYGATMRARYFTIEVPISIVLDRGVVIEPFVQAGFADYLGARDPVLVVGPRLGIAL